MGQPRTLLRRYALPIRCRKFQQPALYSQRAVDTNKLNCENRAVPWIEPLWSSKQAAISNACEDGAQHRRAKIRSELITGSLHPTEKNGASHGLIGMQAIGRYIWWQGLGLRDIGYDPALFRGIHAGAAESK